MIVFDNVTKRYGSNIGIQDVSVEINKGDFVFLVGPSGAGKIYVYKAYYKRDQGGFGKDNGRRYGRYKNFK